ncbi:MAG: SUMF1/EgtB/PvdO family nonheme iron enzyme [Polyangiaceae bacterium]
MSDPVFVAFNVALGIAFAPTGAATEKHGDPGPSPECPADMRLVTGTHFENVQHYCTDPRKDTKDTHCYAYLEDLTAMFGTQTAIRVCMDQYEAPNKKGADPLVMRSYKSSKQYCEERGKRMCSEQEWETACEGPNYLPLSYGWAVDKSVCNSDKGWKKVNFEVFDKGGKEAEAESARLWQGSASGSHVDCSSPFGIFDMQGNVEEWVTSRATRKFPGSLMGGFWAKPWTGCRGTNDAHQPSFVFYETGFRCCAEPGALDADGKPVKK